jgi:hypothetical protein
MAIKKKISRKDELVFPEDDVGVMREGAEGEDDLQPVSARQLNETVVAATDWTTETIVRQLDRQNININPSFQRRDAWSPERKSTFIESLLLGLPIPQLVLAEAHGQKGSYVVIDGKQRLLSLRQFAAVTGDPIYTPLKLTGLKQRPELNGLTLADLRDDANYVQQINAFENQTIRTVVIKNWPDENFLYLIFLRLNTGSVALAPQELRQALHPGPFVVFVDEQSSVTPGLRIILNSSKPDFRMRDAELLVRYYAFRNFFTDYRGNMKAFLDDTCERLNLRWALHEASIRAQLSDLNSAFTTTFEIFGVESAFRKWDGKTYERRANRAVYDIMTHYFSDPVVAGAALKKKAGVKSDFQQLCDQNIDFKRSLETTTKSLDATVTRFGEWAKVLQRRLGQHLPVPKLHNKTIRF